MFSGYPELGHFEKEAERLNFDFLRLVSELARHDRAIAALKFNVSPHFADRISRATTEDLRELARSDTFMFQPRSHVVLDISLGTILSPGVTASQAAAIRLASELTDSGVEEQVA